MAGSRSAWGIEIGSHALKAIRLERDGDSCRMADFAYIPHKKVLSTPDLDADEMTRLSIGQFMSQTPDIDDGPVVVSVPGNAAFARFAKLPPVEPKKVPDIVKFEAVQQIPFPMEEVEWDYETFVSEGSPEVEVGIFAITRQSVMARLGLYGELGLAPDGINLSPVAAYNGIAVDLDLDETSPGLIILDIGTQSTDLIVAEEGRLWLRTFPIGGHNFTETLISAFKLTYSKAEKLKAEAQTSKYRRQILSAMRPVFADLTQEVQRSIQYYQSTHPGADLRKLVGVGSTFKLPGLRKYLSQQLQMEVTRLDEYRKLAPEGRGANQFADHAVNFATAYGLAAQGIDLAPMDINLVPVPVVRERLWDRKIKWFGAAAAVAVFGSLVSFARPLQDAKYRDQPAELQSDVRRTHQRGEELNEEFERITEQTRITARPTNIRAMLDYQDLFPHVMADVSSIIASAEPQPALYSDDPAVLESIPPEERRVLELVRFDARPPTSRQLEAAISRGDAEEGAMPTMTLEVELETPHRDDIRFFDDTAIAWLKDEANRVRPGTPYEIVEGSVNAGRFSTLRVPAAREAMEPGGSRRGGGLEGGGGRGFGRSGGPDGGGGPEGHGGMRFGEGMPPGGGESPASGRAVPRDLARLADLPRMADKYPPGTTYHRLVITWEVRLRPADELFAGAPDTTDNGTEG